MFLLQPLVIGGVLSGRDGVVNGPSIIQSGEPFLVASSAEPSVSASSPPMGIITGLTAVCDCDCRSIDWTVSDQNTQGVKMNAIS